MKFLRFALVVVLLSVFSVAKADKPTFESCACYQERFANDIVVYLDCYSELEYIVSDVDKNEYTGFYLTGYQLLMTTPIAWATYSVISEKSKPPKGKADFECSWSMTTEVVDWGATIEDLSKSEYSTCRGYSEYLYTLAQSQGKCPWVD